MKIQRSKLHCSQGYDSERQHICALSQPKSIKRKHGGVVISKPETKEYKVGLRSAVLLTTLIPFLAGIICLLRV